VQFEFPGTLSVPDGRYLARRDSSPGEQVLVVETAGAPPPGRRRRRRPKDAAAGAEPAALPLTRVTAVRAQQPFRSEDDAARWVEATVAAEDSIDSAVREAIDLLNRALHAQAAATADPLWAELRPERASKVRIGHGSGEEVAAGRFSQARDVDAAGGHGASRRRRDDELRPQERLAAVLGGRERVDACETLLLRARADLDAGRIREAALQLRVALEALLVELDGALTDPDHERDMVEIAERRTQAGNAANTALHGSLSREDEEHVQELVRLCERVLRRRRILRG
jgi:hypothetical protein